MGILSENCKKWCNEKQGDRIGENHNRQWIDDVKNNGFADCKYITECIIIIVCAHGYAPLFC